MFVGSEIMFIKTTSRKKYGESSYMEIWWDIGIILNIGSIFKSRVNQF